MNELEYYQALITILTKQRLFDVDEELENITTNAELIKNSINMRLIIDDEALFYEQAGLKLRCCQLLLQSYELTQSRIGKSKGTGVDGQGLMRNITLLKMTQVLEELFIFFKDFSNRPAADVL